MFNNSYILDDNPDNERIIKLVKTHKDAILPTKAHFDDNCYDLYCVEDTVIPGTKGEGIGHGFVPVGIKVAFITHGFGFSIKPKSGLGFKYGLQPHLGEIDTGYRGDCGVKMYNFSNKDYTFKKGDKVAQIKIEKNYDFDLRFVDEVEDSERGEGGFGSTGK